MFAKLKAKMDSQTIDRNEMEKQFATIDTFVDGVVVLGSVSLFAKWQKIPKVCIDNDGSRMEKKRRKKK